MVEKQMASDRTDTHETGPRPHAHMRTHRAPDDLGISERGPGEDSRLLLSWCGLCISAGDTQKHHLFN